MTPALPAFIQKTTTGLEVVLRTLQQALVVNSNVMGEFVDQLFSSGARFLRLDYAVLTQLLYTPEKVHTPTGKIRLADDVLPFPAQRQDLYKGVRFLEQNHLAEYIFEPVMLEERFEQPLYGDKLPDGSIPITGYETRTRLEKATLDRDELIAALWLKGVRFGIQLPVLDKGIASTKTERVVVARAQLPQAGVDARLQDVFGGMRQNQSVDMANGKADLRRYKNRYPHIAKDRVLLKKIPMQPGRVGFTVVGDRLGVDEPKDFDLEQFAGAGTTVEQLPDGWGLLAAFDGFISLDETSGRLFITEKIESRIDINAKNTGDLTLGADEFISHGEVQEGRVVKGKHMRFTAAVYGNLVSEGGRIVLEDNLSGGTVTVAGDGSISILQRAFNARIEAPLGQVDLLYAESSVIIGNSVFIAHAVNCVILANTLQITSAQACTLMGKSIAIEKSDARKDVPTKVAVQKPDLKASIQKIESVSAELLLAQKSLVQKSEQLSAIKNDRKFSQYLALRETLQNAKQPVAAELEDQFHKMHRSQAFTLTTIERAVKEMQKLRSTMSELSAQIQMLQQQQQGEIDQYYCRIVEVADETTVYCVDVALNLNAHADKRLNALKLWVEAAAAQATCVFSDSKGSLDWHYTLEG